MLALQAPDKSGANPLDLAASDDRFKNTLKAAAAGDMDIDDII